MGIKLMILFAGLVVGLASACSLGSGGSTEIHDDSFVVGDSPRLIVEGDNGKLIVNHGPDRTVNVKATLYDPDDVEYNITQIDGVISVTARVNDGGIFDLGGSAKAEIEIIAPSNTRVELTNRNGHIEVYGMQQSGVVRTSNGK